MRQGAHQGAQKSTTSGKSSLRAAFSSVARSTSTGFSGSSPAPQTAHFGPAPNRSGGNRLTWPQDRQVSFIPVMGILLPSHASI